MPGIQWCSESNYLLNMKADFIYSGCEISGLQDVAECGHLSRNEMWQKGLWRQTVPGADFRFIPGQVVLNPPELQFPHLSDGNTNS